MIATNSPLVDSSAVIKRMSRSRNGCPDLATDGYERDHFTDVCKVQQAERFEPHLGGSHLFLLFLSPSLWGIKGLSGRPRLSFPITLAVSSRITRKGLISEINFQFLSPISCNGAQQNVLHREGAYKFTLANLVRKTRSFFRDGTRTSKYRASTASIMIESDN